MSPLTCNINIVDIEPFRVFVEKLGALLNHIEASSYRDVTGQVLTNSTAFIEAFEALEELSVDE